VSEAAFFDAARALKRELTGDTDGLSQVEVDAFKSIIGGWTPKHLTNPKGLLDPAGFFASIRRGFGPLSTTQVEGFNRLLQAMGVAGWPIAWTAYGLATPWRETNKTMEPVEEGYYLGTKAANFRKGLSYFPWFGRGDVQLTWERNYKLADQECGLNGELMADPALALRPDISAKVLVHGMAAGWFTGKKLADYLPSTGPADIHQFANARRIINGQDAAIEIAENALKFQTALQAGGWA
jgi:putative chitinase